MIKATIVVLMGLVASGVLRRRSAATRHWVLAWTLACAAVVPGLEYVAPSWQVPSSLGWLASPVSESRLVFGDDSGRDRASARAMASGPATLAPSPWRLSPFRWIWFGGMALNLLMVAVGLARLNRIVSRAAPVRQGPWARALVDVAGGRPRAPVRLLAGPHAALLFTWGLFRPAVVLPATAATWPDERIRVVLLHELAHVRRRDWAIQLLAELFRCVYWFNPLVWLACWRLRLASEQACDDAVLSAGMGAPEYASHLLDVARLFRNARRPPALPALTIVGTSGFERRVAAMLRSDVHRSPVTRPFGLATATVLVCLTIPVAGLTLAPPPEATATPVAEAGAATARVPSASTPQAPAAAQTVLGGTIKDPAGKTMPDVVVDVTPLTAPGGPKPQLRTGPEGRFEVKELPAGEYEVACTRRGFRKNLIRVVLKPHAPVELAIAMQIGSLSETINVVSDRVAVPPVSNPSPVRVNPRAAVQVGPDPCANSPVGGCLTPPLKLVDVKPLYPAQLAASGAAATVVVKATLGVDGRLKNFEPEAGPDKAFVSAVLDAVRQWEFTSVRLNGVPQECQVTVTVNFSVR